MGILRRMWFESSSLSWSQTTRGVKPGFSGLPDPSFCSAAADVLFPADDEDIAELRLLETAALNEGADIDRIFETIRSKIFLDGNNIGNWRKRDVSPSLRFHALRTSLLFQIPFSLTTERRAEQVQALPAPADEHEPFHLDFSKSSVRLAPLLFLEIGLFNKCKSHLNAADSPIRA
jgi:hypothetical protein